MGDTITITAGRPNRQGDEKDFTGPDGTYTATLVAVSELITAKSSLTDGRGDGTWTYRDWTFAIDGGAHTGEVIDVRANAGSAGPRAKQYGIIAALVGRTPTVGAEVDIQRHLVGRQCLVSIRTNDNDFPYVDTFMALPPAAPVPEPGEPLPPEPVRDADGVPSEVPF